jgi:hypothetical protein
VKVGLASVYRVDRAYREELTHASSLLPTEFRRWFRDDMSPGCTIAANSPRQDFSASGERPPRKTTDFSRVARINLSVTE